jgi:serine/threonine protein phosphatase PrpC
MVIRSYGMSEIGMNRVENQDAYYVDDEIGLYIVADGMGGMENGAEAADYIVREFCGILSVRLTEAWEKVGGDMGNSLTVSSMADALDSAIDDLNEGLKNEIGLHSGSTMVMLFNIANVFFIANLGDSPGYLFREEALIRLTKEHNVAGILLESGKITDEEARTHPARHQLTAYVGMSGKAAAHIGCFTPQDGDRLLLCTDGLSSMVPENEICNVLKTEPDLRDAAERLVRIANEAGGYDNITVVIVECDESADAKNRIN